VGGWWQYNVYMSMINELDGPNSGFSHGTISPDLVEGGEVTCAFFWLMIRVR